MHLEEFAEGNSFFHRIDPRVKFITFAPYVTAIAVMQGIKAPLAGLVVSAVMILASGIDMRKLLNRLIVINVPILVLWVFLPFSYPGEGLFSIGSFTATSEGVLYAMSITLKANSIVLATIAILGTSQIFSLAHALIHLKAPVKLVYLFFFFYRYISVIHNEYSRLKKTLIARSFRPATNIHTYRTYANLIGMLLVRSYERSQRVYKAMLCRGFKGTFPVMSHFSLKKSDMAFSALMALITVVIVII